MPLFTATAEGSITNAKNNLIQVKGGNAAGKANFKVKRVWIRAAASLVSAQLQRVQFLICTAANAASAMTANTPNAVNQVSAPSIQSTITTWASGQTDGTTTTVLYEDGYDQRAGAGFLWLPTPEEVWEIPNDHAFIVNFPGGIVATTTLAYGITIDEL